MIVLVLPGEGPPPCSPRVVLSEPHNFRQLHVQIDGADDAAARQMLSNTGIASIEEDHVWLEIDALRSAGVDDEPWRAGFQRMIDFAATQGWIQGSKVRAHLLRT